MGRSDAAESADPPGAERRSEGPAPGAPDGPSTTRASSGSKPLTGAHPAPGAPGAPGAADDRRPPRAASWRNERALELVTAVLLGVVAVATAWSGYQSNRWSGEQSARFAEAGALRVEATKDAALAGQRRLYDLLLVDEWFDATVRGDDELAQRYERRFRPEFRPTFAAWLALDPFNNPGAPPGPLFMPQYTTTLNEQATALEAQAAEAFAAAQEANERGDAYVLITVFLATVLFFTAIADHFAWVALRAAVLAGALAMLLFGLYQLAVLSIG